MFLRRASRNRMDCDRNEGHFAESVLRLSGQGIGDWPDGEALNHFSLTLDLFKRSYHLSWNI